MADNPTPEETPATEAPAAEAPQAEAPEALLRLLRLRR